MNNPLCSCTPDPPAKWEKGVCVKCYHWKYTPQFRADMGRKKVAHRPATTKARKVSLPCIHIGQPLTADELKVNGLGEKRKWHWCNIGMAKNPGGIPGVTCKCSGCGPKCEGYTSS